MSARMDFDAYGEAIGNGAAVIRDHAKRAGLDAAVITCPQWQVLDLVAHVGMVHRWVAGLLRSDQVDADAVLAEGLASSDPLQWLDDGMVGLLQALVDAPAAVSESGPARVATARKMAHATSIHAVDAMSASLGRAPSAGEVWFRAAHAADGIDSLLSLGVTQSQSRVRSEQQRAVAVVPDDITDAWTVQISPEPAVVVPEIRPDATTVWHGSAVDLYLHLWNRGGDIREEGTPYCDEWRELSALQWGDG